MPALKQTGSEQQMPRNGQESSRRLMLGTVYELISERGIEGLSMRQIAQAVGMSTGTINYYFKNKQGLLVAALENAYELPPDWEQYQGSAAAQLRRLVLGYVCRSERDRFWRFWINYLAMSTRDEKMLSHQQARYKRQERFWGKLIQDGMASGEFHGEIEPLRKAEELLSMAHGLLMRQLIMPTAETRAHAHRLLSAALDELAVQE